MVTWFSSAPLVTFQSSVLHQAMSASFHIRSNLLFIIRHIIDVVRCEVLGTVFELTTSKLNKDGIMWWNFLVTAEDIQVS